WINLGGTLPYFLPKNVYTYFYTSSNRLVKKGYIERYRDENDRRIVLIRLTENGVLLVQEVKQNAAHYFNLVTEALSEEEKAFLLQIFQKIMNHIATSQQKTEEKVSTPKMKNIPIE
ncbi:MarR family transcriptional regulator, partial [Bacillus paranthracis]|uniref:MarR family winged helix-turn-helix transcriptional regulator n=3 Tax=Bacillus paranthracis TaxID=2026186 RepID=UPI002E23F91C|nr:MarR family transcriptional regulator [Bacillus paranthracis]